MATTIDAQFSREVWMDECVFEEVDEEGIPESFGKGSTGLYLTAEFPSSARPGDSFYLGEGVSNMTVYDATKEQISWYGFNERDPLD